MRGICLIDFKSCAILKEAIKMKGQGFKLLVSSISFQATTSGNIFLKDIGKDLVRDTEKLLQINDNMNKVFQAVSNSLGILRWLRDNLKGIINLYLFCFCEM